MPDLSIFYILTLLGLYTCFLLSLTNCSRSLSSSYDYCLSTGEGYCFLLSLTNCSTSLSSSYDYCLSTGEGYSYGFYDDPSTDVHSQGLYSSQGLFSDAVSLSDMFSCQGYSYAPSYMSNMCDPPEVYLYGYYLEPSTDVHSQDLHSSQGIYLSSSHDYFSSIGNGLSYGSYVFTTDVHSH